MPSSPDQASCRVLAILCLWRWRLVNGSSYQLAAVAMMMMMMTTMITTMTMTMTTTATMMNDDDDDDDSDRDAEGVAPPFKYFALHDVESVWWLLTFALFGNGVKGEPPNKVRENLQVKHAQDMFPRTLTSLARQNCFTSPGRFAGMRDSLPDILHPLFNIAKTLRRQLVRGYLAAEKDYPALDRRVPFIILRFRRVLRRAMKLSQCITLVPGLEFNHKRSASLSADKVKKGTGRGGAGKRRRKV
ncbi:hypothetical protein BD779DRAFT_214934 [Infundibulicybe gibba]|nr:hypothetical protein BD779DRAFT_214934 [Infundibulicybe gibba]